MAFEKRFNIRFDDALMPTIHTVRQTAEEVCRLLGVEEPSSEVRDRIASIVLNVFPHHEGADPVPVPLPPSENERLSDALLHIGCALPDPGPFKRERMLFIPVAGNGSLKEPTVDQFIDRIVAHNHNVLLWSGVVLSRHDVGMVVLGITADSCGLPVMRVSMDDSFTYDLGID